MPQETMNIALPDAMKEFVLQQVAEGGYSTASEYVRELIRADQKQKAAERIDALLLEGLKGGSTPLSKKDWSDIRAQVSQRLKKERAKMIRHEENRDWSKNGNFETTVLR